MTLADHWFGAAEKNANGEAWHGRGAELGVRSTNLTFNKEEVRRQEVDFLLRRTEQFFEVG